MIRVKIAGTKFCEPAAQIIARELKPGDSVYLVREHSNRFDRRAVRIECFGHKIGYVPADHNRDLSRFMDSHRVERLPAVAGLGRAGPTVEFEIPNG